MTSIPAHEVDLKPKQTITATNLPAHSQDPAVVADSLSTLVNHSAGHADVRHGIHAPMHKLAQLPFVHKLIPGLEKLASEYHVGNYVINRETGDRFWESMPIYPRLGMHLLFYGGEQRKLLHNKSIESILEELSIRVRTAASFVMSAPRTAEGDMPFDHHAFPAERLRSESAYE